jgi:hypothetical protein
MNIRIASSLAMALLACATGLHAAQCLENRDFHQSLPTVIGREDSMDRFAYQLKCDTVFVRKGVTTVVYPGTMLYFAQPSLNSVIKVEGTLIIKGAKSSYVYLSGSLDSLKNGTREPGNRPWGGIEVAEGGRLEMEFAGVMRAPTPITAFSPKVRIINSFFKGSSGLILPDGNLMPMEVTWHAVNDLNLEKATADKKPVPEKKEGGISEKEKAALLAKKPSDFWTWKKAAGGAAAVVAVAAGALYFAGGDDPVAAPPIVNPPVTRKDTRDPAPDLPDAAP